MVNAVEIVIIIIHGVAFRAGFIILLYGFFYFFRFCLFLRFGSGLLRVGFRIAEHITVRRAALEFARNFLSAAPAFSTLLFLFLQLDF